MFLASSTSIGKREPDLNTDDTEWKCISMDEIYKHLGPFNWHHLPPMQPSPCHTILFEVSQIKYFLPKFEIYFIFIIFFYFNSKKIQF